jgi:hypothetical protein
MEITVLVILSCLAVWVSGGIWIIASHGLCQCGGAKLPVEQFASLGSVSSAGAPGVYIVPISALPLGPGESRPAVYWEDVQFSVFDPHWVSVPIRFVCVESRTGPAEGIWSGTNQSWGPPPPSAAPRCTPAVVPSGAVGPGSNVLDASATLLFYLGATAPFGTTFAINETASSGGNSYDGSLSQTLFWLPP